MNERTVAWFQTMTDFTGSPVQIPMARQVISVRVGSSVPCVSLVLSNEFGVDPLVFERVSVASGGIKHAVSFSDEQRCVIEPGAWIESDPIPLGDSSTGELLVDITPAPKQLSTTMGSAIDTSMVRPEGVVPRKPWYYYGLCAVIGHDCPDVRHVCFFGDSLTNQALFSGPASLSIMSAYPDVVACNCGISGNRLLRAGAGESSWVRSFGAAGLERFSRDVTAGGYMTPNVVFSMVGVNDLFQAGGSAPEHELPTADEIISGFKRLDEQAEAIGSTVIMGTLTPFCGSVSHGVQAWTEPKEKVRRAVNEWLRLRGRIVDVDMIVCDEGDPTRLSDVCDCGDHLHLSRQGGRCVSDAIVSAVMQVMCR